MSQPAPPAPFLTTEKVSHHEAEAEAEAKAKAVHHFFSIVFLNIFLPKPEPAKEFRRRSEVSVSGVGGAGSRGLEAGCQRDVHKERPRTKPSSLQNECFLH